MAHIDCHKQTPRSGCNCPSAVAVGGGVEEPVVDGAGRLLDRRQAWADVDLTTIQPLRVRFCVWASSVAAMVPRQACNSEIRRSDTRM